MLQSNKNKSYRGRSDRLSVSIGQIFIAVYCQMLKNSNLVTLVDARDAEEKTSKSSKFCREPFSSVAILWRHYGASSHNDVT